MYTTGWTQHPPTRPWGRQAAHAGCLYAVSAALAALFDRRRTGKGQHVDISLQEAVASTVEQDVPFYVGDGVISGRRDNDHTNGFGTVKVVACEDGWVHLNNISWRAGRNAIVQWMAEDGMAGDLTDDKWLDDRYRRANIDHLVGLVSAWAKTKTKGEFFHEGQKRGLECAPINSISGALADPQLHSREYWVEVEHPELRRQFSYPGAPCRFEETPWSVRRRAPLIGEDNTVIYQQELDMSKQELRSLAERGIV
jgi:benzylsuccinate CoA-transferase BbsE subunit